MLRTTGLLVLSLSTAVMAAEAQAQGRWNQRNRNEIARLQGVPPGQLPPRDLCRVFYENRAYGRQPPATTCRNAEAIAARDRYARVIYGEDAYAYRYGYDAGYGNRRRNDDLRNDDWRYRDPRLSSGVDDRARTPAYETGLRDGLQRGREDASRRNSYDVNRHGWYRSADRGYNDRYGSRDTYEHWYREGFEAGYAQAYRGGYDRR
jgi:hypothetical protein